MLKNEYSPSEKNAVNCSNYSSCNSPHRNPFFSWKKMHEKKQKQKQTKWLSAFVARLNLPWLPPCSFHVPHTKVSSQIRYPAMLLSFHCLAFLLSVFISIQFLLPTPNKQPRATCLHSPCYSGWETPLKGKGCLPIPSMAMFVFHYLLNITSKYRNMVYVGLNDLCYSNISVSNHFLCIYPYLPH